MNQIGKNTPNAEALRGFVERIEDINAKMKDLREAKSGIFHEAERATFSGPGIRYVIKARAQKPHDRQEAEAVRDIYMHALGMDVEPPLFRQIGALVKDAVAEGKLLDALKAIAPPTGEIIMKTDGKAVRIYRDTSGTAHVENYIEQGNGLASRQTSEPPPPKKEVPVCTTDEAEKLGEEAAKNNAPVIENPFPFNDERRPRWDSGWRTGSGNNGMGG